MELVPGYGIFISPRQLDEAEGKNGGKATKLIRNLMGVFFEHHVLAKCSALGSRKNPGLDQNVVSACISKCLHIIIPTCISSLIIIGDSLYEKGPLHAKLN